MRKQQQNSTSRKIRIGRRQLRTEQLERREMLAADFLNAGAALVTAGGGFESTAEAAYVDVSSVVSSGSQGNGPASVSNGNGSGNNGRQPSGQGQSDENQVQSELSTLEIESLLHMREEEKLARDVYDALGDRWNVSIFDNIAEAESKHMESVLQLLDKYGLEDPVGGNAPGEFTNPVFETLYVDLVEQGSESLLAAYQVGALIEELDIVDLQQALEDVGHEDIEQGYENLLRGSRNHLRSFAAQIEAAGSTYDAQYLTQSEFDAIADSPAEKANNQDREQGQEGERNGNPNSHGQGKQDRKQSKGMGSKRDRTERPEYRASPGNPVENVSRGDQDRDKDQERNKDQGRNKDQDRGRDHGYDRVREQHRRRAEDRDRDRDQDPNEDGGREREQNRDRHRDRLFFLLGSRQGGRRFY